MATIREVASYANVSVATVSRVINNKGYVDANTKEMVLRAIKALNYVPNSVAQALAGKKMNAIALVVPDISNPFFAELAKAVEDTAQRSGFTVFLCNSDGQLGKVELYMEVLKSKSIDGIIFATNHLAKSVIDACQDIPIVLMDRAYMNTTEGRYTVISANNRQGVRMAIQHLRESGCRKIAHIYGPQELITARERCDAYRSEVADFAWADETLLAPGDFRIEGGRMAMRQLLQTHPDLDGVFVGNDMMAIGALKQLRLLRINVPDEIAICGFDGIPIGQLIEPELTTVAQPISELGHEAARTLIRKIKGFPSKQHAIELDVELVVRHSTRRQAAAHGI